MNPYEMWKQMSSIQNSLNEMQAELKNMSVEGSSGADLVKVIADGAGNLKSISISDEAMAMNDKESLEVLILSAANDALTKSQEQRAQKGLDKARQYGLKI